MRQCRRLLALAVCLLILQATAVAAQPGGTGDSARDWLQWGGTHRNFKPGSTGLAETWPADGPPRLWRRELGEGYSAILYQNGVLYTMYRNGEKEVVLALAAADGDIVWQFDYDSPTENWRFDRGAGPHATPALAKDRLFTAGSTAKFHALDRRDGSLLWSHDLRADFGASFRHRGYSSSPIVYQDTVIVPVGGQGKTVIAFRQGDGSVAWQSGDDDNSYSSPILIDLDGQTQLVVFAASQIVGLDPGTGAQLWSHSHPTRNAFNISTPLWGGDGLLFASSAYDGGGRALRLKRRDNATTVEELWFSNQVRVHFGTAVRQGNTVYASSGDFGPAPLTAVDLPSGEILWRDRAFAKASLLYADDKVIVLDEDGVLGLVKVSRQGLRVLARAQVFDGLSWTVPTLVGTKLYLRSREEVLALDLGK